MDVFVVGASVAQSPLCRIDACPLLRSKSAKGNLEAWGGASDYLCFDAVSPAASGNTGLAKARTL
jgi:hypothetical protein